MTPSPRERVPRACEHCRSRKIKCNGEQPCNACSRNPQRCVYRTGSIRNRKSRQNREQPRTPATLLPAPQSPAVPGECPNIRLVDDPAHYKRQYELRAGIGVSNPETGNFQFYGEGGLCILESLSHADHVQARHLVAPYCKESINEFKNRPPGNHFSTVARGQFQMAY